MNAHSEDSPLSELTSDGVQGSPSTVASSVRSTRRHKIVNYSELNSGVVRSDDGNEMEGVEEVSEEDGMNEDEEEKRKPGWWEWKGCGCAD